MEQVRIAELLAPYLGGEILADEQLGQLSTHVDLLMRWNARMNLTSVRDADQIVERHVGESVFAGRALFPDPHAAATLTDIGSGAGFPGLPIAIIRPGVQVTLVEAHGKKATFLKEAVRSARLRNVSVAPVRAEAVDLLTDVVTFRAVEHFQEILQTCARLVVPGGRLGALVGSSQVEDMERLRSWGWSDNRPIYFPGSSARILWISRKAEHGM